MERPEYEVPQERGCDMTEKESRSIRKKNGGRRPGAGRPFGVPNKLTRPLKELAALHSEDCIAVLDELRDHAEAEQVRLQAANSLLDRAYGRPRQELDLTRNEELRIFIDGKETRDRTVLPALEDHSREEG